MRRFFINSRDIAGGSVTITGSDVHHIRDVLRLSPGGAITVVDESATEYDIRLDVLGDDAVTGIITATRRPKTPDVFLALYQGLPKATKFDEVIKKATELGADSISAVIMERSEARADAISGKRLERWRRIGEAAAKQSRRPLLPEIPAPLSWGEFKAALADFDLTIVFWEGGTEPPDKALSGFSGKRVAIVIGPEGGLSAREITALTDLGAKTAWLGPRILRTETAPVAALAIVNHILKR